MDECRKELKQTDIDAKAMAVSKLTYVWPPPRAAALTLRSSKCSATT